MAIKAGLRDTFHFNSRPVYPFKKAVYGTETLDLTPAK